MKIEHIAIWVNDLELMKSFYEKYFNGVAGDQYHNPTKGFTSYFLSFNEGARLELMYNDVIPQNLHNVIDQYIGMNHMAISMGNNAAVDEMTDRLRTDGFEVVGEPRTTGDGYYESVILDPESNRLEITI